MKKFIAINNSEEFGTSGTHDFDTEKEALESLENVKAEVKEVVSSEDELFEMMKKAKSLRFRQTLGITLARYNYVEEKPKAVTPVRPMPKYVAGADKLSKEALATSMATPGRETDTPTPKKKGKKKKGKKK